MLDLEHLLFSIDPDVVVITETWLLVDIRDREIMPQNYVINIKDSRAGGAALVLRQNISSHMTDLPGVESISLKLYLPSCKNCCSRSIQDP